MAGIIERVNEACRKGGLMNLLMKAADWGRRRRYRALSRFQKIRSDIDPIDLPQRLAAGCMYDIRVKILNRSRIAWNIAGPKDPPFMAAAVLYMGRGLVTEELHHRRRHQ